MRRCASGPPRPAAASAASTASPRRPTASKRWRPLAESGRRAEAHVLDSAARSLADAEPRVFWTDRADAPAAGPSLEGGHDVDVAIVGGGYTGLWGAILALEDEPGASVMVMEADRVAAGASGRNGGFVAASLTHGLANGLLRWPREMDQLLRMGRENFADIARFIEEEHIDADFRPCGKTTVAVEPHHLASLRRSHRQHVQHGEDVELLDAEQMRADVDSPTYLGGLRIRSNYGTVDPARLAWGLADAARRRGAVIHESTAVTDLVDGGGHIRITTAHAVVKARRVIIATNAFQPPLRRLRAYVLPLYDHVLTTEPLDASQMRSLGWPERQGLTDPGNRFHYYRLTPDDRVLWGGYDAVYYYGNRVHPGLEQRDESHTLLARHFLRTFPQLEGIRFSHRWAGVIDSTSRFTPAFGTAMGGKVAYAVGYTGLGVAASRFGAQVALDLLHGHETERTRLRMVRRRPFPFPPEPLRWLAVRITQAELARQDRNDGRPTLWLRLLDRLGMGFAS